MPTTKSNSSIAEWIGGSTTGQESKNISRKIMYKMFLQTTEKLGVESAALQHGSLYADYAGWAITLNREASIDDLQKVVHIVKAKLGRYKWWKTHCAANSNMITCVIYRREKISTGNERMK